MKCRICNGAQTVSAFEHPTDGWLCDAKDGTQPNCNRPDRVRPPSFRPSFGNVRKGTSPCPRCTQREIVRTETDDFGFPNPENSASDFLPLKTEDNR